MLNYKLSTFLEICETKNYTKTAEKLHMTQPAVTQHIKYLEQYYGTKLFYYDEKKRLHLTDQGRLLRSYAQSVQADSEIIKNRLSVPINEPDVFKLGSLTGFGDSSIGVYMEPALTTVEWDPLDCGYAAAKLLHERMRQKKDTEKSFIPYRIAGRDSVMDRTNA